jgi:hypothetical protein
MPTKSAGAENLGKFLNNIIESQLDLPPPDQDPAAMARPKAPSPGHGGARRGAGRKRRDTMLGFLLLDELRRMLWDDAYRLALAEVGVKIWRADVDVRKTPKKLAPELRTVTRGKKEYRVPKELPVSADVLMFTHVAEKPENEQSPREAFRLLLKQFRNAGWKTAFKRRYLERLQSLLRSGELEKDRVIETVREIQTVRQTSKGPVIETVRVKRTRVIRQGLVTPLSPAQRNASFRTIERAIDDALECESIVLARADLPPQGF